MTGPEAARPPLPWRVAFAAILTVTMASGTFPGFAFGVLGSGLVTDFGLSRVELGFLTTTLFLVGAVLSLAAGPAVDQFGAKRIMIGSFVILSIALLGMASAPSYAVLLAFAALAGLSLAIGNPVTNKLVAVHIPPGRRGLTMGSKQAGVQLGAFLTGALLAPLAAVAGWRVALLWSAAVPLVAVLVAAVVVPRDAPGPPRTDVAGGRSTGAIRWLAAYAFLMGSGTAVVNAYLPLYLIETVLATPAQAGAVVAVLGVVGVVSRIAWGWGAERLRSYSLPLIMLGAGAVLAISLIKAVDAVGLWLAFPAAALFGATAITWNSVGMLAVLRVSGVRNAGRDSGIVVFGFYCGFVASPVLFGWMVDGLSSYGLPWIATAAIFAVATMVGAAWRRREGQLTSPATT